jgi:TDG/mug DNA glycosylase family protein
VKRPGTHWEPRFEEITRRDAAGAVNWLVATRGQDTQRQIMRTLPDYLRKGMKLVIVGCNPSESSVRVGHYYAGRVNQFWPVLYKGGVVPEPFDYHDDKRVIEFGIGLTDLVKRPTKTTAELTREDFAEGRIVLSQRLGEFTPHVIAFNGKLAFEQFAQRKCKYGLQKEPLYGARVYVLPETNNQDEKGNPERVRHFRKLAQLVASTATERAGSSKGN